MTALSRVRMILLFALVSTACTPVRNTAGPFGTPTARIGNRFYRLRLEVVCDQCYIRYTIGSEVSTGQPRRGNQVWSVTLNRSPTSRETVRLMATTPADRSAVQSVRIFIDGDLVASDENSGSQPRRTLSAETGIPPDREEPSRAEGGTDGFAHGARTPDGAPEA